MTRRRIDTYQYTCDNFRKDGKPCDTQLVVEVAHTESADAKARHHCWKESARGWNCPNDHLHRYPGSMSKEERVAIFTQGEPND